MPSVEFKLPELGEKIESGEVIDVLVAVGDTIVEDQPVIELETDKAVIEVPSPVSGVVRQIHVKAGDKPKVGQLILTLEAETESAKALPAAPGIQPPRPPSVAAPPESPPSPTAPSVAAPSLPRPLVPAAPSVRRLAREIGVEIAQVPGSGPGGRISEADVKAFARRLSEGRTTPVSTGLPVPELPDFSKWGEVERQPMGNVRRVTAERLTQVWATVPQVTQFDKADITELDRWRKEYGKRAEAANARLTPTAILLKVAASALKLFPQFNASLDLARQEIVYKKYYHIGVAVDTERGLLVPVIRDVDRKNLIELAIELGQIAEKARARKLTPEEMQGGCFTVSNLGSIGGTGFTPILNPPEVAILGAARAALEPVFVDGEFRPRLMMPLSLTFDHRLIDGADGARFLRWVAQALENPFLLILEG